MSSKYDFAGYATRNNLKCSDGRVIRQNAFKECDGLTVPLVWQHNHQSPDNVLGHALLENREDGVYAYCSCNNSKYGDIAKELVSHGDISSLSIYANQLTQAGSDVTHGVIREVSLVLSGANPGAVIDNLAFEHSDGTYTFNESEAVIYPGAEELYHAEDSNEKDASGSNDDEETVAEVFDTLSEKQKMAVYAVIQAALEESDEDKSDDDELSDDSTANHSALSHADASDKPDESDKLDDDATVQEVFDTLTDAQKQAVYAIVGAAVENAKNSAEKDDTNDTDDETEDTVKHNAFDANTESAETTLSHADITEIFADAKRSGSLKDAVLAHGITGIDVMFPEAQLAANQPGIISRNMEWVDAVLNGVHKTPFSVVKSVYANLTADEARAKGYIKGRQKVEEQISALKRKVSPTTIYKLQKLDRDDVVDITDFDVVAWIKQEMRTMLNEEVARAILIGDGRSATSNDKIDPLKIIPIWTDAEVYTVHVPVQVTAGASATDKAKAFIESVIRARRQYKGSGAPTLFVGPELLTDMRLIRDTQGYRLYKNDQELADELRVAKIVEVEVFDNQTRTADSVSYTLGGIIVNLTDYNVGATNGGEVSLFDDFDLNYNKYEYLLETRCSGALVLPKSALAVEFTSAEDNTDDNTDGE